MAQPAQGRPNRAALAERNAKIFNLKIAGVPEREIGREVGLSQARVNEIVRAEVARRVGPVADEYADFREAELTALWRAAYREQVTAKSPADRLKAIETCRRINESRRRLRGADAPESMEITHTANMELSAEISVRAITTALERLSLPPDRMTYALEVVGAVLEGGEVPPPMSSGLGAAPYVDRGVMYVDGPPGSGIRYRVAATERQPGPAVDVPALLPAPAADADVNTEELDLIEAEFADILEGDDDGPEGDQEAAS
ncbi:hypothetical protein ACIPX0_12365 [Streptomyces sp. NPDC090075]|uniref:hypothetical protein n=1 Tax=Streptomyces sp. NPDC090075 TaxID=3365937 RepID=UPI0038169D4A